MVIAAFSSLEPDHAVPVDRRATAAGLHKS
jgi:hypothetical protein